MKKLWPLDRSANETINVWKIKVGDLITKFDMMRSPDEETELLLVVKWISDFHVNDGDVVTGVGKLMVADENGRLQTYPVFHWEEFTLVARRADLD